jgi:hypothetical protein
MTVAFVPEAKRGHGSGLVIRIVDRPRLLSAFLADRTLEGGAVASCGSHEPLPVPTD